MKTITIEKSKLFTSNRVFYTRQFKHLIEEALEKELIDKKDVNTLAEYSYHIFSGRRMSDKLREKADRVNEILELNFPDSSEIKTKIGEFFDSTAKFGENVATLGIHSDKITCQIYKDEKWTDAIIYLS